MYKRSPLVQPGDKYCHRCATVKPVAEFYSAPSRPDGRDSRCKACAKAASRQSAVTRKRLQEALKFCRGRQGAQALDLSATEVDLQGISFGK